MMTKDQAKQETHVDKYEQDKIVISVKHLCGLEY